MKLTSQNNANAQFKGLYNNRALLKSLEKISDHSASFSICASTLGALVLRPFVISKVQGVDNENKKYACANSISSALMKFVTSEAIAIPIENAVKNIQLNPEKYLTKESLKNYNAKNDLNNSKNFKIVSQTIKLASNVISAVPKSFLSVAFIPFIMDYLFKDKTKKNTSDLVFCKNEKEIYADFLNKTPNFTGKLEKITAGVFNNSSIQNFLNKHNFKEENTARNAAFLSDSFLTFLSCLGIKKSKKIKEEKKSPLIYNNLISTAGCLISGCALDGFIKHGSGNFMDKFINANKNNPKLSKYIQGINVLRPTLIFALIYYGILPVFSTYFADKIDKTKNSNTLSGDNI